MTSSDFDIYHTASGYVAVTNDVRRTILNALAKKERQLPELVKLTKRAKPTLSSVHMKELLDQNLVEELAHPTDKRKKIYRIRAKRIGSSSLPVEQLRDAVKRYVVGSPDAARFPLAASFDALAAALPSATSAMLRPQARRLGAHASSLYAPPAPRDALMTLAGLLEREGLARPLRLDLEANAFDLELGPALPSEADDDRLGALVAGFVEGVLDRAPARERSIGHRRIHLQLPPEPHAP